jgi:hypothetical protein
MSRRRSLPWIACVALGIAVLAAAPARGQDYPRLGLYGSMNGAGYPLWDGAGALDPAAFDQIARYHEVVLDASPITPYRPDALAALRARRPGIVLLAYVTGHFIWPAQQADSLVHYPTRYHRLVRDLDGFLYNTDGEQYGWRTNQFANVNLAKRDPLGRYVVAEALADLFHDAIVRPGIWDGVFFDTYCDDIEWMQLAGETIDYARAGYPTFAAFKQAWRAGSDTLASRMRRLSGPDVLLVGNCGQGTKYAWFNGWMREDFPNQNGGSWSANMYNDPGGYFVDEARFRTPRHNYIFSAAIPPFTTPYTLQNAQRVRFGLASAALGGGFGVFGPPGRAIADGPYHTWWYDEYAVDLATGSSSSEQRHTGWLGQALGAPYQMIWITPGPDAVTNPGFETDVTTGWTFLTVLGSTLARDATTAAVGSASARITVPVADPASPWSTGVTSIGTLSLTAGQACSATFWARASVPRAARVAAGIASGPGQFASRSFDLTPQWTRYQVTLTPSSSGISQLEFHLAGEVGDVWLDDVHFQNGVTSVYRRDFQNGAVLVNPGAVPQSVVLERPFRRISGLATPSVNDGVESATVLVPAMDARFLIGVDVIAPAQVLDLHPIPPPSPR